MNKTVLAITAAALAAAPAIAAAAPAWCGSARFGQYDLKSLERPDVEQTILTLVEATCNPTPEATAAMPDIDAGRAAWGTRLGMTDADWADAVAWAQLKQVDRNNVKWDLSTKDLTALTPLDQYRAIKLRFHAQGAGDMADSLYIADALEPTMTEVGRLAAIEGCIDSTTTIAGGDAVLWAICEGDIKQFDAAKFATQLRGDTAHPPEARMGARMRYYALAQKLKTHAADVDKTTKIDPAYKKMFDIADQARAEWASGIGKNTAALALATAMDSATFSQSRSQSDGCEDKTSEALRAAVAKLSAKTFDKMNDERNDPLKGFAGSAGPVLGADAGVQLAAIAYIQCQPFSGISVFLSNAVSKFPTQRGPRNAVLDKLMGAPLQLDNKASKILYPSIRDRPYFLSHGAIQSFGGVVKSITPNGDTLTVEFEKTSFKQLDCVSEHKTDRIVRIEASGELQYEVICDNQAMVEHNNTHPPVQVAAKFGKLFKVGERISLTFDVTDTSAEGKAQRKEQRKEHKLKPGQMVAELTAVWPNKTATGPTVVLGAVLK